MVAGAGALGRAHPCRARRWAARGRRCNRPDHNLGPLSRPRLLRPGPADRRRGSGRTGGPDPGGHAQTGHRCGGGAALVDREARPQHAWRPVGAVTACATASGWTGRTDLRRVAAAVHRWALRPQELRGGTLALADSGRGQGARRDGRSGHRPADECGQDTRCRALRARDALQREARPHRHPASGAFGADRKVLPAHVCAARLLGVVAIWRQRLGGGRRRCAAHAPHRHRDAGEARLRPAQRPHDHRRHRPGGAGRRPPDRALGTRASLRDPGAATSPSCRRWRAQDRVPVGDPPRRPAARGSDLVGAERCARRPGQVQLAAHATAVRVADLEWPISPAHLRSGG